MSRRTAAVALVAAAWLSLAASPPADAGAWSGRTPEGAAFVVVAEDARTLRVTLRDLPAHDRDDQLVLAVPWWGPDGEPPRLTFERARLHDVERDEELLLDPAAGTRDVPRRLGLTSSLEAWFSIRSPGVAVDLPVVAVCWSLGGVHRAITVREVTLRLDLGRAVADVPAPGLRPLSAPARERLEALVANASWIDRCRLVAPPAPTLPASDWAFPPDDPAEVARWRVATLGEERALRFGRAWFEAAGFSGPAADPARARLFRDGREVPTLLLADGSIAAWVEPSALPTARDTILFVEAGADAAPLRMASSAPRDDAGGAAPQPVATIRRREVVGDDASLVMTRDQFLTLIDFAWIARDLPPDEKVAVPFALPFLAPGGTNARFDIALFLSNGGATLAGTLDISVNEAPRVRPIFSGRGPTIVTATLPAEAVRATGNVVTLIDAIAARREPIHLDHIAITYDAEPFVDRVPFPFALEPEPRGLSRALALEGLVTGDSPPLVLDITDPAAPARLDVAVDAATLAARVAALPGSGGRFVALTELELRPAPPGRVPPHDPALLRPGAEVDQWIVYDATLREGVERLAAHRRAEGWSIGLAEVGAIEASFGTGQVEPDAIRRFLAFQFARAARVPASVLLVGDATHDWQDGLRTGVRNFVPAYREGDRPEDAAQYPVDLHYARLAGDDWLVDVALGRLSVNNAEDLAAILDKLLAAEARPALGPWRARAAQVADTGGFVPDAESVRLDDVPPDWGTEGIYLDRLPWIDNFLFTREELRARRSKISPAATTAIRDAWNEGLWLLMYWGHGSPNIWSSNRMWFGGDSPNSDNLLLDHAPRLPFVANMTCNTGAIDYPLPPWNVCMTEDILRQRDGGALAVFAPGGMGIPAHHRRMATALVRALTRSPARRLGDVVTLTRWEFALHAIHDGTLRMYGFQGDPLAPLPRPAHRIDVVAEGGRYLAPGAAAQTLAGELPVPLRRATTRWAARVVAPGGEVVLEEEGTLGALPMAWDGGAAWRLPLAPRGDAAGRHTASIYFWDDDAATDALGGAAYEVGTPALVVREVTPRLAVAPAGRPVRLEFIVENLAAVEAHAVPLRLDLEPLAGRVGEVVAGSGPGPVVLLDVAPRSRRLVALDVIPPSDVAAVHPRLLRHAAPPDAAASPGEGAPLAIVRREQARSGLYPIPSSAAWGALPGGAQPSLVARFDAFLLPGPDAPSAWLARRADAAEGRTAETAAARLDLAARTEPSLLRLEASVPLGASPASPARGRSRGAERAPAAPAPQAVALATEARDAADTPLADVPSLRLDWTRDDLPDLRLVGARARPERPVEGETVWLEVDVANAGRAPARDVVVRAWDDSFAASAGAARELLDRSSPDRPAVPLLAPGERRTLVLRWDPEPDTPRALTATLRAATAAGLWESGDAADNVLELPVAFRSNFELRLVGEPAVRVATLDAAARRVRLAATVENVGEAPADRVEVNFYASRDDAAARRTPVATVDLPRVVAGGHAEATAEWTVPLELARAGFAPSVVVNVKGSRQRVAADTAPAAGAP